MDERVRKLNDRAAPQGARYVLYWAQASRRAEANHGLAFAVELANQHRLPVLFYDELSCSYPYANDRLHTFALEGVPELQRRLEELGIGYVFHLRQTASDPGDVPIRLAAEAAAFVTDDYPSFRVRWRNGEYPRQVDTAYYVVDSSCIVPMGLYSKREYAAYTIRPKIRKALARYMKPLTLSAPECRYELAASPYHTEVTTASIPVLVASSQIDHSVAPSTSFRGGRGAALGHLERFLENRLRRYAREKNEPSAHATSNLSPYLHFGQIGALEIALAVRSYAEAHELVAEEFLEELIVRRELAFNYARFSENYAALENIPEWARKTLEEHAGDERDPIYRRDQFERAATHDPLWNATQKELLLRGKIHGYYRMYWGKKIIEWSPTCQDAADTMTYLHDRFALDGRDPSTYTNILWCFGLHDRPWKERPIFGKVRYMSLSGMERKTDTAAYIEEIRAVEETGVDPRPLQ